MSKAERVRMQHRIDMEMLGIKAGFNPNQLRDPHTGEWISIGIALSAEHLGQVLDAMHDRRDPFNEPLGDLEDRLMDARLDGGGKLRFTLDELSEMIGALADARDRSGGGPGAVETALINAREKLERANR